MDLDARRAGLAARIAPAIYSESARQDATTAPNGSCQVAIKVRAIETERLSPRYSGIDLWQPADILEAMIEGQFAAVGAVRAARPAIERAALAMESRLADEGRLIYAGAGTSGRLAVQDGAELMPTFSWPRERLVLLIAGGDRALIQAVEGAEDEVKHAQAQIKNHKVGKSDVLIAVAASGTTPFTLACLRSAKRQGALTIGIANNPGTAILDEADHAIFLETGPEPIAGSTRMKAGTAQRITLSLLSSLLMIRLGRVYDGMMVDVQATNKKLGQRSETMLMHLTGRSQKDVRAALAEAEGNVKLAVLLLKGCELKRAKSVLARSKGQLRTAIARLAKRDR
jgi:N-acetylmuramic acid 6-phosphate etherase